LVNSSFSFNPYRGNGGRFVNFGRFEKPRFRPNFGMGPTGSLLRKNDQQQGTESYQQSKPIRQVVNDCACSNDTSYPQQDEDMPWHVNVTLSENTPLEKNIKGQLMSPKSIDLNGADSICKRMLWHPACKKGKWSETNRTISGKDIPANLINLILQDGTKITNEDIDQIIIIPDFHVDAAWVSNQCFIKTKKDMYMGEGTKDAQGNFIVQAICKHNASSFEIKNVYSKKECTLNNSTKPTTTAKMENSTAHTRPGPTTIIK